MAAEDAKRQIFARVATMLDVSEDQLYREQSALWVRGGTEPALTLAELAEMGRREKDWSIIGQASFLAEFPPSTLRCRKVSTYRASAVVSPSGPATKAGA